MDIVVIGLGSMGRRRIRLIGKYDSQIKIVGIDSNDDRRRQAEEEYAIATYASLEEVRKRENIDCAFISTSPLSHAELIQACLSYGLHVFTELNLVNTLYDENLKLAAEKGKVLFLSSTFLYRKELQYINKRVSALKGKVNYTYHAGQYLPDWHPWENYKNFFVGKKETSGCREFMAIEFPWICKVFGTIKNIEVRASKISSLDLDYPDNYMMIVEHENGNRGMVTIDVVSRKAVRNLEIFGEDIYLTWNGTPDSLMEYDYQTKENLEIALYDTVEQLKDYSAFIIEDAYYNEIVNFFGVLRGQEQPKYSFEQDKEILNIIDKIEEDASYDKE